MGGEWTFINAMGVEEGAYCVSLLRSMFQRYVHVFSLASFNIIGDCIVS